jgi:hypothetical protein
MRIYDYCHLKNRLSGITIGRAFSSIVPHKIIVLFNFTDKKDFLVFEKR